MSRRSGPRFGRWALRRCVCGMAVGRISRWAKCQCGWRPGAHGSESLGRASNRLVPVPHGQPVGRLFSKYRQRPTRPVDCRLAEQQRQGPLFW